MCALPPIRQQPVSELMTSRKSGHGVSAGVSAQEEAQPLLHHARRIEKLAGG
jgi:hypothetical protein